MPLNKNVAHEEEEEEEEHANHYTIECPIAYES